MNGALRQHLTEALASARLAGIAFGRAQQAVVHFARERAVLPLRGIADPVRAPAPLKPRRSPVLNLKLTQKKYQSWQSFIDNAYWNVELK